MRTAITDEALVRRLLERTGFHASADAVAAGVNRGPDALLARLLRPPATDPGVAATPAPKLPNLEPKKQRKKKNKQQGDQGNTAASPMPSAPPMSDSPEERARRKARNAERGEQRRQLALWWLDRMVAATYPWAEVRTWLWHGHFATSIRKVKVADLMIGQYQTERRLGGGDFQTLARAMAVDPAMMIWLDGVGSTKDAPNENLARELMELFILGVGNYTEADVRAAAAALTGYRINRDTKTIRFDPGIHAAGAQTILGVTKDFTANDLVDLLVSRPASPRYLAARMWKWLVSDTTPQAASLDRVAAAYGSGRDVTAMFTALFSDAALRDPSSVIVKDPVSWLVGGCRALGVRPSKLTDKEQRQLLVGLNAMGQVPFNTPSVGGWPVGASWLNTAATQTRFRLAALLVRKADLGWLDQLPANQRVAGLARRLGTGPFSSRTTAILSGATSSPPELITLALCSTEFAVSR